MEKPSFESRVLEILAYITPRYNQTSNERIPTHSIDMAIYEITPNEFREIEATSFGSAGLQERQDLQRLLRTQFDIVASGVLIIAEEFSEWEESARRIDLLGIDKDANLVVIELKRTDDGGHMELQSLRYAAMVSAMTFDRAVEVFASFLKRLGQSDDAKTKLLNHLEWEEPDEDRFGQDVRIILVSADFSKELTTTVLWLMDHGIDLECVRIKPYRDGSRILADIQRIIPLPEAEDYQIKLKEKQQRERATRKSQADYTKYDVSVNGQTFPRLSKRGAIYTIVRHLIASGHAPEAIAEAIPWKPGSLFRITDGELSSADFIQRQQASAAAGGKSFEEHRYYCGDEELLHFGGRTYALTNQWGPRCLEAIEQLAKNFPQQSISVRPSE